MDEKAKVAQLEDYIMKNCLWQFHSRAWDRVRQNENILGMISKILCDEEVDKSTPEAKCYWAEALCIAEAYKEKFKWLSEVGKEEIKQIMFKLKERIDFLTITGSLNQELNDPHY